jgi:hypothetical protein
VRKTTPQKNARITLFSPPLFPFSQPHIIALWERRSLEAMMNAEFEAMTLARGQTTSLPSRKYPVSPRKQSIKTTIKSPIANQGSGLKPSVDIRDPVEAQTEVWEGQGLSQRERSWMDGGEWRQWGWRGDVGGGEGNASLIEGSDDEDEDEDEDKMKEAEKMDNGSLGEGNHVAKQESFSDGSGKSSSSSRSSSSSNADSDGSMR